MLRILVSEFSRLSCDMFNLEKLRRSENNHVVAVIIEEGIANADFGVFGADQVFVVVDVRLVKLPPGDDLVWVVGGVVTLDVFCHPFGNVTGIGDAALGCGTIGAIVIEELVASHIVGVRLGSL